MFKDAKTYLISVQGTGYTEASVQQAVGAVVVQPGNPNTDPPHQDPSDQNPNPLNLAFERPTASSPDYHRSSADAVDGRFDRRWESAFEDNQWMSIDLESVKKINRVVLNWENAYGKAYTTEVSLDGQTWKTVYATDAGNGGTDDISFAPVDARYVKMNGIKRGTPYGFSLWEFEVYGGDHAPLTGPALTADSTENTLGQPMEITFADDAAWRSAINAVELDGVALRADQYAVSAGKITLNASLFTEAKPYLVTVGATGYEGDAVVQPIIAALNLALNMPTTTSDIPMQAAQFAVDGDKSTRWESAHGVDPQWLCIDLGKTRSVSRFLLNWENASAKAYTIDVSVDGSNWSTVYSTTYGDGGKDNILINPVNARFIKMTGTERNTQYGYSLFEFEVYE